MVSTSVSGAFIGGILFVIVVGYIAYRYVTKEDRKAPEGTYEGSDPRNDLPPVDPKNPKNPNDPR